MNKLSYKNIVDKVESKVTNNANDAATKIKGYLHSTGIEEKVENQYYIALHEQLNASNLQETESSDTI